MVYRYTILLGKDHQTHKVLLSTSISLHIIYTGDLGLHEIAMALGFGHNNLHFIKINTLSFSHTSASCTNLHNYI